jgi:hypothetical protein
MASNSPSAPALVLPATPTTNSVALSEDIHGIRPPVYIPNGYLWIFWVLGAVALLLALWFVWKKWSKKRLQPKAEPVIPPHIKAKERLQLASQLFSEPYKFCSLVSDVIRNYLEERFNLRAPERTTEEFLLEMQGSDALNSHQQAFLTDFLSECDMVKFARFEPTIEELQNLLASASRLVDETAPLPTEPSTRTEAQSK